jgi:hypothetical protein
MRPLRSASSRPSLVYRIGQLLAALALCTGIIGVLHVAGFLKIPWAVVDDPFQIRIPINARPIPAYTRVSREDMLNPQTGSLMTQRLPPESVVGMSATMRGSDGQIVQARIDGVQRSASGNVLCLIQGQSVPAESLQELGGAVMNVNAIIGRVVRRDKRAGLAFREDTFFPQGTPEGIAGATPPGMRAITLDAADLLGVHSLQAGDRLDLMASLPAGDESEGSVPARLPGLSTPVTSAGSAEPSPVLLANSAIVLRPVYVRSEAAAVNSLMQGRLVRNEPHYEVALAVDPEDVIPIQNAINRSLKITCIAHSMQVAADSSDAVRQPEDKSLTAPVTVRMIAAYEVVTRDAFVNPATRQIRMETISADEAARLGIETRLDRIINTVARHDIPAGSFLRNTDLLRQRSADEPGAAAEAEFDDGHARWRTARISLPPQDGSAGEPTVVGDRPAVASFIPAGRTAFAIPWNRVYGGEHLQIDDRIDLLASWSLESTGEEEETETRPDGTKIVRRRNDQTRRDTLRTLEDSLGYRSESWFVAGEAIVVVPVGFPAPAAALRALGNRGQSAPGEQGGGSVLSGPALMVAVEDRDVERMAAALAAVDTLFTVALHATQDSVPAGKRRIAVAAQDIPEYSRFSETVWLGGRRRPVERLVDAGDERFREALDSVQLSAFYGRTLRAAKTREDFFRAGDFFDVDTNPGYLAAATPGTVLMAVSARLIGGLDAFNTADQVAILERSPAAFPSGATVHSSVLPDVQVRVMATAIEILSPARGGRMILKVPAGAVARLQAALSAVEEQTAPGGQTAAGGARLEAVGLPRQNGPRPDQTQSEPSVIPEFQPLDDAVVIESIVGGQRTWDVFGSGKRSQGADR